ncbi:integrase [Candidatus Nitrosocosmicus agrestis]|jgi:hypothetical protein|uniref:integrase n=1 Tax=Candidatus Nitrosocosmicus agrestis TaxID=2563600 RepID=UPI001256A9FB|nr:integrase [Candidatus Nitrosocosmicus sp. SS]KAA2279409.1 hypothetical protein F1Z66_13555 [Candidatus Nitrosocosmicus sp. SS]KAF0868097.1 hypothetical protein E5N71_12095 [Candidatus Nitrosocosmicus sp. SS]
MQEPSKRLDIHVQIVIFTTIKNYTVNQKLYTDSQKTDINKTGPNWPQNSNIRMLRPGFEPGIVALRGNVQIPSLEGFQEYLESSLKLEKATVRNRMVYAKKYHSLLQTWNFSELAKMSIQKRGHVMRALSLLSKYQGQYEKWQQVRNNYQLKWSNTDSLNSFRKINDENNDINSMIDWVRQSVKQFPRFANVLIFNTLTGLRPTEAVESFNLLSSSSRDYLSKDGRRLEHFRFPSIFIRRTKKAFISIMNKHIMNLVKESKYEDLNYSKIRLAFQRNNKKCNMSYCRKIFATFLRNEGVEPELIDLLQGRIPNSIFVRHYYRPQLETIYNRVADKLDKLNDLLTRT